MERLGMRDGARRRRKEEKSEAEDEVKGKG